MKAPESSSSEPDLNAPLVALRAITKLFDNGVQALDQLDLTIRESEFLSLLGPSGCGKSTALRLIAGLADPTSGAIVWRDGRTPPTGFVFQEPTLMPWTNIAHNVWLPLRLQGMSWKDAEGRIMAMLERVGLADFSKAYPRELSGGMKMRAAIARALVTHPPLLLLDEPFAALDEITRFRLNDDLLALSQAMRTTIVFVTHSVYESVYLSQRIAVFSSRPGRIVETLEIETPHARDKTFRLTPEFSHACARASAALEGASAMLPIAANYAHDHAP